MSISPDTCTLFTLHLISTLLQPCDYPIPVPIQRSSRVHQHWSYTAIFPLSAFPLPPPTPIDQHTSHFPIQKPLNKASSTSSVPISPVTCPTAWAAYRSSSAAKTMSEDAE